MLKHRSGTTDDQMQPASPRQHQHLVGPPAVGTGSYWTLPKVRQQRHDGYNVGEGVPQHSSQRGIGYASDARQMKYIPPNSYWTSPNMRRQQHGSSVVGAGMRIPYQQYTSPTYAARPAVRFWNLVKNEVGDGKDLLSSTCDVVASSAAGAGTSFASAAYRIGSKVKGTVSSISRSMATFLDGGQEQQLREGLGGETYMRMQGGLQPENLFHSQAQRYQPRRFPPTQDQSGRRWDDYTAATKAPSVRFQSGQGWGSLPLQPEHKYAGSRQDPSQYRTDPYQGPWQQHPTDDSHQGPPPYISGPHGGPLTPLSYPPAEHQQQHPRSNQSGPFQYPPGIHPRGQQQQ